MKLIKGLLALTIVGSMSVGMAEANTCTPGGTSVESASGSSDRVAKEDTSPKQDHFESQNK